MNKELLAVINTQLSTPGNDIDITTWRHTSNNWLDYWDEIRDMDRNGAKTYVVYVRNLKPKKGELVSDNASTTEGYIIYDATGAGTVGSAVDFSKALKLTDDKEKASTFTNEWINSFIGNIKRARNMDVSKASFDKFQIDNENRGLSYGDTYKDVWLCTYFLGTGDTESKWATLEKKFSKCIRTLRQVLGDDFDIKDDVWKFYKRVYEQTESNDTNFDWTDAVTQRLQILCSDDYSDIYTTEDAGDSFLGYFMFNKNLLLLKDIRNIVTIIRQYHNGPSLNVRENYPEIKDWINENKKVNSKLVIANCIVQPSGINYDSDSNTISFDDKSMFIDEPGKVKLKDTKAILELFDVIFGGTEKTRPLDIYINDNQIANYDVRLQKGRVEKVIKVKVNEGDTLKIRFDNKNVDLPRDFETTLLKNDSLKDCIEIKDDILTFKKSYNEGIKLYIGKNGDKNWILHDIDLVSNEINTEKSDENSEETPTQETQKVDTKTTSEAETSKDIVSEFTNLNLLIPQEPEGGTPDGDVLRGVTVHVGDIIVGTDGKYYSVMKKNIGDGKWDIKAGTKIYRFKKDVVDKINQLGFSLKPGEFKGKLMDSLITSAPLFDNK